MGNLSEAAKLLRPYREDFVYYAPRALRIRPKAPENVALMSPEALGVIPLVLNRAQMHLHAKIEEQKKTTGKVRVLGLKGRQQGFSTYVEGRFYWLTTGTFGCSTEILTHEAKATENLFGMVQRYHDHCPDALKPHTTKSNAKELVFSRLDSKYGVSTAGTRNTGRSLTAQLFHGSEVAFWPNDAEHMSALGQAIPDMPGTEVILESTGNGESNMFYAMWQDATRGLGDYIAIFVPWFWQDEYQSNHPDFELLAEEREYMEAYQVPISAMQWRRKKIINDFRGDIASFDQEYPAVPHLAFQKRDIEPYIPPSLIWRARKAPDEEGLGPKIMGVDPAEYGDDDTCVCYRQGRNGRAFKGTNRPGYDRWHGLDPMEVVGRVARQADIFLPDDICVDATGIGSGVASRLRELGYPVTRVIFGERAHDQEQYGIRKDELYGDTKAWLEDFPCNVPDDDAFQTDATAPGFTYDSSRRLRVETKEKMKKRGVKSPDGWEALCLTHGVHYSASGATSRDRAALQSYGRGGWR